MNQFIHINEQHVVNLSNVTEFYLTHSAGLGCSRTAIVINFVGDTPLTIYNDMPAYDILKAWMDKQPTLAQLEDAERVRPIMCYLCNEAIPGEDLKQCHQCDKWVCEAHSMMFEQYTLCNPCIK